MSSVRQGWVLGLLAGALALVVTAPGTTLAQTSTGAIRGHVLDENGEPLTAASVQATSTASNYRRGMLTEEAGFYNLGGLPVGEYNVEFSHPSYGAQTQNVRVHGPTALSRPSPHTFSIAGVAAQLTLASNRAQPAVVRLWAWNMKRPTRRAGAIGTQLSGA